MPGINLASIMSKRVSEDDFFARVFGRDYFKPERSTWNKWGKALQREVGVDDAQIAQIGQEIAQMLYADNAEVLVSNEAFDQIKCVYAANEWKIEQIEGLEQEHLMFQGLCIMPAREWS